MLVPEYNEKQKLDESSTNKYIDEKYIVRSYGYKLVCVDDKFTNEDNEDFESYTKCWICDNDYVDNDV